MADHDSEPAADWATQTEQRLLDAAVAAAPATGWSAALVARAARDCGLTAAEAELLLPGGPRDLAALLSRRHDAATATAMAGIDPQGLKIRERIRVGVETRLETAAADEAALRRCAGFLALPFNLPLALRLAWESADHLWRWAGDVATDENHYSKRAILAGILVSATAVRLTNGREAAKAYVGARIDNVMAFEKWKATRKRTDHLKEMAEALSRMRYGRA
ncbi:COQ9 family protein [Caulobacter sp. CCUG 60055]|uniref:COQ9 family protein n=1 Tax=Caulobacter sp. CCUG 60055 TaxID=2100090 RepID=UPI001FA73E11|nr:COQ9 family protein [Caulobacter sp. CCUG 60055]MCI3180092.1 COQ9 family protein [Caulobacter sp. CCUG 60055]